LVVINSVLTARVFNDCKVIMRIFAGPLF
jgi:hypothetical protein